MTTKRASYAHIVLPPICQEFLDYYRDFKLSPAATIKILISSLKSWVQFLTVNTEVDDLLAANRDHVLAYRNAMKDLGYSRNYMDRKFYGMRHFYDWAEAEGKVFHRVIPRTMMVCGRRGDPRIVPTPLQIFQMRTRSRTSLRHALVLEVLLSTGMRINEFVQIRCCDINLNHVPRDTETGLPSKFFAGKIRIDPKKMIVKTRRPRWVYLSVIARNVLLRYLEKYKVPINSDLPLFPWDKGYARQLLRGLGDQIISTGKVAFLVDRGESENARTTKVRTVGYRDVDPSSLENVDIAFRRGVLARQASEARLSQADRRSFEMESEQEHVYLHPHALRYAMTSYLYYRSPFGERKNSDRVRIILGHASVNVTNDYLFELDLVSSDTIWNRLWLGKPGDWQCPEGQSRKDSIGREVGGLRLDKKKKRAGRPVGFKQSEATLAKLRRPRGPYGSRSPEVLEQRRKNRKQAQVQQAQELSPP